MPPTDPPQRAEPPKPSVARIPARAHPGIAQAHVIGLPDRDRGEVVAAFVEPSGSGLTEEDVRSFVRERASRFKVPSHVFFRTEEQLPRLQTGKVPKPRLVEEALRELGADANTEGAPMNSQSVTHQNGAN